MSKLGNFRYNYVVHHNFSRAEPCIYDNYGREICTLDTTFVDGYILIEEHKCCCRSGYCAVILYDQSEMVLPIMKTVVDLTEVSPLEGAGEAIRESRRIKGEKGKPQLPSEILVHGLGRRIPYEPHIRTNTTILIVWPLFLILVCLFCAVGFFNICRDDLMDELHSSGIDVIRSEEGGVKQAPREYEY
ncbi:hypothetical protein Aduo_006050 [Ancylostoma duodenale]